MDSERAAHWKASRRRQTNPISDSARSPSAALKVASALGADGRVLACHRLRQANVTHLRWDQLDMRRRIAWIHADQAKGRSAIAVPLPPAALAVLRKQLGNHEEWVFPSRGGPILQPANTAWVDALEKSKLQNFRWHDLRHTWASWHVQNGTPLPVLMELGGWKDLKMVLRYAHLAQTHVAKYASNGARFR